MPFRCLRTFLAIGLPLLASGQELPRRAGTSPVNGDAALFRNDGGDPLFPDTKLTDTDFLRRIETPNVGQAQTAYEQAQRKAQRWQQLGKSGVLAQVEVERATLQAARARARFEHARVAQQQADLESLRTRTGETAADTVRAAEAALQTAQTMAAEADTALQRTELLIAEANVDRQRRLIKFGAGSKTQLQRAETTLLQLKREHP